MEPEKNIHIEYYWQIFSFSLTKMVAHESIAYES